MPKKIGALSPRLPENHYDAIQECSDEGISKASGFIVSKKKVKKKKGSPDNSEITVVTKEQNMHDSGFLKPSPKK
jgi:hypothetical protein